MMTKDYQEMYVDNKREFLGPNKKKVEILTRVVKASQKARFLAHENGPISAFIKQIIGLKVTS